jgi:ferredoxin
MQKMIVGRQKPFEEICESLEGYKNILILGCGTCVSVCLTGGEKEAQTLARAIAEVRAATNPPTLLEANTLERQCERDWVEKFLTFPDEVEVILSLACGAGVQTLADVYPNIPIIPALNTTFLGAQDRLGVWNEKCVGCGDCILVHTGGICPIARCAKRLFNGPCGGSSKGKCEISAVIGRDVDCAWQQIFDRLSALGKLEEYEKIRSPKDWSSGPGFGPRTLIHTVEMPTP